MDPQTLARRRRELRVLDVRYPNEWDAGHIDGAVHIPVDDLAERVGELERDRPLVTVCRSGERSDRAAQWLVGEGFDAENLQGGMEAWAEAGLDYRGSDGAPGTVADPEPPPDDRPAGMIELQDNFLDVVFAAQERFGDRQPSDEEMREFLRDRLVSEGKSPEEADEFLSRLGDDGG
jgi:rhodanese-related sulfurtransferase